jgi:hypothetical protein
MFCCSLDKEPYKLGIMSRDMAFSWRVDRSRVLLRVAIIDPMAIVAS